MGLFDFLKRTIKKDVQKPLITSFEMRGYADKLINPTKDKSNATGKDFEFLITGDINVFAKWDQVMTPNSFVTVKVEKENWIYYKVEEDEFSYSIEPPGIQMTFNDSMPHSKAKAIGDEILKNIIDEGNNAQLVILNKTSIYSFP